MKDNYIRLKALLLAGALTLTSATLTGCGSTSTNEEVSEVVTIEDETKTFKPGEHILSIPLEKDIRKVNVQFDYYPGYEPVGISVASYGKLLPSNGGGVIMYSNIEEVECTSYVRDKDGNPLYLDFGTPMYDVSTKDGLDDSEKEFGIGEHIISVPLKDYRRTENFQYEYHEGYEVVGIAASAYGELLPSYGGGALLYKNVQPVKCIKADNGYTTFGTPIELEKGLRLN